MRSHNRSLLQSFVCCWSLLISYSTLSEELHTASEVPPMIWLKKLTESRRISGLSASFAGWNIATAHSIAFSIGTKEDVLETFHPKASAYGYQQLGGIILRRTSSVLRASPLSATSILSACNTGFDLFIHAHRKLQRRPGTQSLICAHGPRHVKQMMLRGGGKEHPVSTTKPPAGGAAELPAQNIPVYEVQILDWLNAMKTIDFVSQVSIIIL
jgi:hypothetical protein